MNEVDFGAMEARIAQLEALLAMSKPVPAPYIPSDPNFRTAVAEAENLLQLARRRDKLLGHDHLHEPGWQLLLDMFVRQADKALTSVTSACIGSGAASATALRYLKSFEQKGWIVRTPDPQDARRTYLSLNAGLMDRMTSLLLPEWERPARPD